MLSATCVTTVEKLVQRDNGGEDLMTNLSQIKRDRMKGFLEMLKQTNNSDDQIKAINEIENFLDEKRYGLVWEEHEEEVDVKMRDNIPVFTEDESKKIISDPEKPMNFLLEGDNLHSLYLLEKTHKGKIDVIYIDPPYNTNNSLTYDDSRVSKEDAFRHSKWLSFIESRIKVAKNLLSEEGVIYVSIDDNEYAAMKLLLDSIFGEENYVVSMPRQTKRGGKTTDFFAKNNDYLLVYTNRSKEIFELETHDDPGFKNVDEFVETRGKYKLNQTLDYDSLSYSRSLDYPIEIDGEVFYPGGDKDQYDKRKLGDYKRADWAWRWSRDLFEFGLKNGFIVVKKRRDGSGGRIYTKTYLNAKIVRVGSNDFMIENEQRKKAMSSLELTKNNYSNDNAKKDLARFGLKDQFDYPKPVELIRRLIKTHRNKDAIVLDFFAGSGTTAEATLYANLEDGGNRRYILCTNNENNIIDKVTYPRVSDVIKGYKTKGKQSVVLFEDKLTISKLKTVDKVLTKIQTIEEENSNNFLNLSKKLEDNVIKLIGENGTNTVVAGISSNLKYFKTDFIPYTLEENESLTDTLLEHIKEMAELEYGVDLATTTKVKLVLDEDELDEFFDNEENKDLTLLVPIFVLLKGQQEYASEKRNITLIRVPDYYFASELKEAGEL